MSNISQAHKGDINHMFVDKYADGVPYENRGGRSYCAYCGSLHPSEIAALVRGGMRLDPADRKYGWPHKFYGSDYCKFYTRHLIDATPEDYETISKAIGLYIA